MGYCVQIAFVERSDNIELMAICQQAILVAKLNLISYIEIQYTATSNITAIAAQINGTTSLDAVVGCMTSSEATTVYKLLDTMKKPMKNYYFVSGPQSISWNAAIGSISQVTHNCDMKR